jgi:hypothetical protein
MIPLKLRPEVRMKIKFAAALVLCALAQGAAAQLNQPDSPLLTQKGWEFGAQVSHLRYEEPATPAKITSGMGGGVMAYTFLFRGDTFARVDGRITGGSAKYDGMGFRDNVSDGIFELRGAYGKDFILGGSVSMSPYAGLGSRNYSADLRGNTSTGVSGYRRSVDYLYAPLGLTMRIGLGGRWVLAPNLEYDWFLRGRQFSQLSDASQGSPDARNTQRHGHGYRAALMVEWGNWAFGPWMNYWRIKDSDTDSNTIAGFSGIVPNNWTREYGLEVRYRWR